MEQELQELRAVLSAMSEQLQMMNEIIHTNPHAGAAPAQIGMKTGRRNIARFLIQSA